MGEQDDDVFDLDRVRELVQLMIEHELTEVDLRQHGQTIRLKRGGDPTIAPTQVVAAGPTNASHVASPDEGLLIIKSPMVGTYYSRANPEGDPFVKVGQDITADSTVCIIEAMKVFNEIPAEVAGKVVAILVEDEEAVEFGKPLMKVRPHS
jgi:acetyl-CoA carboxylase biotin carboxyl carrier protein